MNSVAFLATRYDPWAVVASLLLAMLAGYVALDLANRVRTPDRNVARWWWAGGSLALGSGIWSMHFVGMLAYELPFTLGYGKVLTLASWVAAVLVSAVALGVATHRVLTKLRLLAGSLLMGAGICAMHYIGMAAIDLSPGIVWNRWLVGGSVLIAVAASGVALTIFFQLRRVSEHRGLLYQGAAAVVLGLAISGMHYTGMAAASVPAGAVCLSADSLAGSHVGTLVVIAAAILLMMTLATSIFDAAAQRKTSRLAGSLQSANEQLQVANEELKKRAFLDALTNLPNRLLFEDRLAHAVTRTVRADERIADRAPARLAVLFIDLDGFKPVNDSLGHAAGDAVLQQAALRLRKTARDSDTVARVGGDEFLLLMEEVGSLADCVQLARRMLQALSRPFDVNGHTVEISGSIGIVLYPDQGHAEKLIAHADSAMYVAKRAGGNTYAVFESRMDADALDQLNMQNDLRHAIELQQLELYYQPKVDCTRGNIIGAEALLRWKHPVRGMVSPTVFIPLAERFGFINRIGQWVINESCRQIAAWAAQGVNMRVAINLSVHQLREDDLVSRIRKALDRHGVAPSQLLCEITESLAMEDIEATQKAFDGLAEIGVFLSIDDFGTGYSSLSYLRKLPARQVKIDRSFINDLEASDDAKAIVDAVIRLAHALGLDVVAEGVETKGQREILRQLGCDELQGFFFARPMPAHALFTWVAGDRPAVAVDFTTALRQEAA
jgi:diguanylate cyclase (GGDEF)-like protein